MNGASLALGAVGLAALAGAARGARAFGGEDPWGDAGAGVLLTTGTRVFLLLRSEEVTEGGTWGTPGGAVEEGEDSVDAALRELEEEAGLVLDRDEAEFVGSTIYRSPDKAFRYVTSVLRVPEEVADREPELNWESEDAAWVTRAWLLRSRRKLHPGLQAKLDELLPMLFEADAGSLEGLPEEVQRRLRVVEKLISGPVKAFRDHDALTITLPRGHGVDGYFRISKFNPEIQNFTSKPFRSAWISQLRPEVWAVRAARLDTTRLEGLGVPEALYETLVLYAMSKSAWVVPEACIGGKGVKFDTTRVWENLRKQGWSYGPMLSLASTGSLARAPMFFQDLTCPRCGEDFQSEEDYYAHMANPSIRCREAESLRKSKGAAPKPTPLQTKTRRAQREKQIRDVQAKDLQRVMENLRVVLGDAKMPALKGKVSERLDEARRILRRLKQ